METAAIINKLNNIVSHQNRKIAELRADRELAIEYLKAAMESLDNPDDRAGGLMAYARWQKPMGPCYGRNTSRDQPRIIISCAIA